MQNTFTVHSIAHCIYRYAHMQQVGMSSWHACVQAVHWAIDELKASVPIWKKEFFSDGSIWKENAESRLQLQAAAAT
jgi:molybdopterin synthase catalytic subunit